MFFIEKFQMPAKKLLDYQQLSEFVFRFPI